LTLLFGDVDSITDRELALQLMSDAYFDPDEYETLDSFPKGLPSVGFNESKFVDDGGEVNGVLSNQANSIKETSEKMSAIFLSSLRSRIHQLQRQLMEDIKSYSKDMIFAINEVIHSAEEWGQFFTDSTGTSQKVDPKAFAERFQCKGNHCNEEILTTGICRSTTHFECFKEIIEQIGTEDQGMLLKTLRFVTGANMFPVIGPEGVSELKVYFTKNQIKRETRTIPNSSTCSKTVYIEVRDSDEQLKKALIYALNNYGDAFTLH